MILVTVGTQLPFPRLIRMLDDLASQLDEKIIAQAGRNSVETRNIECHNTMEPRQFEALFLQADRIVAHAGIGTILAAKKHHKPIILVPRRAALGEHRNDHQMATVRQLGGHKGIYVAQKEAELLELLRADLIPADDSPSRSLQGIQSAIGQFIAASDVRRPAGASIASPESVRSSR